MRSTLQHGRVAYPTHVSEVRTYRRYMYDDALRTRRTPLLLVVRADKEGEDVGTHVQHYNLNHSVRRPSLAYCMGSYILQLSSF